MNTWLDVRDLEPGAAWEESVVSAINGAAGFVFLIGPPVPAIAGKHSSGSRS